MTYVYVTNTVHISPGTSFRFYKPKLLFIPLASLFQSAIRFLSWRKDSELMVECTKKVGNIAVIITCDGIWMQRWHGGSNRPFHCGVWSGQIISKRLTTHDWNLRCWVTDLFPTSLHWDFVEEKEGGGGGGGGICRGEFYKGNPKLRRQVLPWSSGANPAVKKGYISLRWAFHS